MGRGRVCSCAGDETDAVVRPFRDADLAATTAALVAVHGTDGYPVEGVDRPESWLRSPHVLASWVAESDAAILGHVALMRPRGEDAVTLWTRRSGSGEDHVAVLARLFVLREARGQSIGEQLTTTAMEFAKRRGLRPVLDVMTKDSAAIRLHERLGWTRIGEAAHHYGDGRHTAALCYVAPG